jgi:hypothetical protein
MQGTAAVACALAVAFGSTAGVASAQSGSSPATRDWPGTAPARIADAAGALGGNLSGLAVAGPTSIWAVRDAPSSLLLLDRSGDTWTPRAGWGTGRTLTYPDGHAGPDAEAVTTAATDPGAVYVGAERDNGESSKRRNSVLRYDTGGTGALRATTEWRLDDLLDTSGPNTGIEALTWVPDRVVVAAGLRTRDGRPYDPSAYGAHRGGVFVIGVEQQRDLSVVVLRDDGRADVLATVASGLPSTMELHFDAGNDELWALCDDTCGGLASVLVPSDGGLVIGALVRPPQGSSSSNNEGFARLACSNSRTVVVWSDDSATGGHALREADLPCGPVLARPDAITNGASGPTGASVSTNPAGTPAAPATAAGSTAPVSTTNVATAAPSVADDDGAKTLLRVLAAVMVVAGSSLALVVVRARRRAAAVP